MTTPTTTQDDLDLLLVCAERYSINGGAFAAELVPGIIRRALPSLYNDTLQTLIFDLEHSLHHEADKDAAPRPDQHRPLWVNLLTLLVLEKGRRQQAGLWHLPSPSPSPTPLAFDGGHL